MHTWIHMQRTSLSKTWEHLKEEADLCPSIQIFSHNQEKLWQLYHENPAPQQNTELLSCCSSPLRRASTTITNKGALRGLDAEKTHSDSSTKPDGGDDGARESREETYCTASSICVHTVKSTAAFFISDAFITLDRSPELPSKLLILSHKVYCQCIIALHFRLC